jgi:hypothetical protein
MSKRRRITPEQIMDIYREVGFPLVDQILAGQIVAGSATEEEQAAQFLMLNSARDFTSDDPALWSQARTLLARLETLARKRDEGVIDADACAEQTRHALIGCSPDLWLAVLNLHRSRAIAFEHVMKRGLTPS